MRIGVFDYHVVKNNPIGGCHLNMIEGLCDQHEFVVFARDFVNPRPDRIRHVRVPALRRPMALLYLSYHLCAPIVYLLERLRGTRSFDVLQGVESNFAVADVTYSQFCHSAFLENKSVHADASAVRGVLRWLDHKLHSMLEPFVYRRTKIVVVPSKGLRDELVDRFPRLASRIRVIANPIDTARMRRPADFDPAPIRDLAKAGPGDILVGFVALGHFERKGLPLLLKAMAAMKNPRCKLLVVGGANDLIRHYQTMAEGLQLQDSVIFAGSQSDVRQFLWAFDVFALPSQYEAFPLVALEAAAAGVPLLVTPLHGTEEYVTNGQNGFVVDRSSEAVQKALSTIMDVGSDRLRAMGERARASVQQYSIAAFLDNWRALYDERGVSRSHGAISRPDHTEAAGAPS
jgi:glycosyltransferase involved in cell wall biosynthesis